MIDQNILMTDFEGACKRLARKRVERGMLEETRGLLDERRKLVQEVDEGRAGLNSMSKRIGQLLKEGKKDEAGNVKTTIAESKAAIAAAEETLAAVQEKIHYAIMRIPNFPEDAAPDGTEEKDNVILRVVGYDKANYEGKSLKPHWEIATKLGIFDSERAAKISGSMFSLLRGKGAKLLRALVTLGLDVNESVYEEILPPHFVRTETFTATGHLPKFEAEAYKLRDDDLWAIPTGEVPLMSLHRDETLTEMELPKRYMAYTVCFRREAGAAGKDTRGMQRLHEFHKVEMVRLCTPEQSDDEFAAMVAAAEKPLQLLNLPYRVVDLCTADLTFSSARVYDLEVYAPGIDKWLEVSSVGKFTDFQTRRANTRFKRRNGKLEFVYALNGSAMATPRVWAAVIENYQQPDGSVRVPEVLQAFMGCEVLK